MELNARNVTKTIGFSGFSRMTRAGLEDQGLGHISMVTFYRLRRNPTRHLFHLRATGVIPSSFTIAAT